MKNRKARFDIIAEIITRNCIGSQEELLRQLAARGIKVTQATLSRDLKRLNTVKVSTDMGGYRYIIKPEEGITPGKLFAKLPSTAQSIHHPAALSLDISGNIIVIKTVNGYASGLAYDIDMLHSDLIMGTIPGADTVFAVCRENTPRAELLALFEKILPASVIRQATDRFRQ